MKNVEKFFRFDLFLKTHSESLKEKWIEKSEIDTDSLQNIWTEIFKFQSDQLHKVHIFSMEDNIVYCRKGKSHKRNTEGVAKLLL